VMKNPPAPVVLLGECRARVRRIPRRVRRMLRLLPL
jgi:hypothetical protein